MWHHQPISQRVCSLGLIRGLIGKRLTDIHRTLNLDTESGQGTASSYNSGYLSWCCTTKSLVIVHTPMLKPSYSRVAKLALHLPSTCWERPFGLLAFPWCTGVAQNHLQLCVCLPEHAHALVQSWGAHQACSLAKRCSLCDAGGLF